MAATFPGAGKAVPGVYTDVETLTDGVAVPSGARTAILIGEGNRTETVINSAAGGGNDGIGADGSFTGTPDGRHFQLGGQAVVAPLISNRTRLFRNGIELNVLEDVVDSNSFDNRYDARVDLSSAVIELQSAALVDQGGEYYKASGANVGNGNISNISLLDPNAPAETWTAKVTSVRRDGYGNPIDGYAKFVVRGSVSGVILDGSGNQIVWQSDNQVRNNGVLQFSINEGAVNFVEGDSFIFQIFGGSLKVGESLSANYIAEIDINDPQYFDNINMLVAKHGRPSATNRISLGAQLAFANGTPGIWAMQAAPSIPRRASYPLVNSANGEGDIEELTFELPLGVVPDVDSNINFFIRNPITKIESQIIPNKVDFYNSAITSNPSSFIFGAGYDFSYTVIMDDAVVKSGNDGELVVTGATTATMSSDNVLFELDDLSATRSVIIENATNVANNGSATIVSISAGIVTLDKLGGFVNETGIEFQVTDSESSSARILFTDDLALSLGESLRATLVDTKDADFYDPGWVSAYDSVERIEVDMVVPLPSQTISVIFQNGKSHVERMSSNKNKRERVLMIGAIKGLDPDNVLGVESAAVEDIGILEGIQGDDVSEILAGDTEDLSNYDVQVGYGDTFRVFYFYPDSIVVQAGSDRIAVDGFFIAAAAAGYFSGNDLIQEPLTNKVLGGFSLTRDKLFSPIVEENVSAHGISMLRPVAGGGLVIFGKTTTNSLLPEEEEMSIIFIRDRIAKDMRVAFAPFVGKAETPTFQQTLFARATAMAQGFITRKLITAYKNVTVSRDPIEPRQWAITLSVMPVYPINWIYIKVGIGAF